MLKDCKAATERVSTDAIALGEVQNSHQTLVAVDLDPPITLPVTCRSLAKDRLGMSTKPGEI